MPITGTSEGQVVFDPAPLATVTTAVQQVQGTVDAPGIPESRLPCVARGLQAAVSVLAETAVPAQAAREARTLFAAFITNDA